MHTINHTPFMLTAGMDILSGTSHNDIFMGTYSDAGTGTFGSADVLNGGVGTDTLNITPIGVAAITPSDIYWSNISHIEKIVIDTTNAGAQTITTGAAFELAFAEAGVDVTSTSNGGAISIDTVAFSGAASFTTSSGAGAQTITTGLGHSQVNATSGAGAQTITGENIAIVTAISGSGAQTITLGSGLATVLAISDAGAQTIVGANLVSVNATAGAGAQTIISTGAHDTTVVATSGVGATTIVTGAGNDSITLFAVDAGGVNYIAAGAGADTITLVSGALASPDTIMIGSNDTGIALATADKITGFDSTTDFLKMGVDSTAANYVEANLAVHDFAAALNAANSAFAEFSGIQQYSFQWDATNGYLFNDLDGNGTADQVVVLVGVTDASFAVCNIVA